ncbi:uncharacterized protein SGFS_018480 [Streptomyces graminofaciens]|uniref:Uncharacterized protein n=1 Tax=Streptomyces graminofaciens TaxID=68212 RepID=A0ABM7F3Y8_9ACTN|nr:uncharacterized protein SGFS_018480 [Streptomyces graminofaciens]
MTSKPNGSHDPSGKKSKASPPGKHNLPKRKKPKPTGATASNKRSGDEPSVEKRTKQDHRALSKGPWTAGSAHPRVEPGTFDAAALLKSVLAVVEPTMQEGLRTITESALRPGEDGDNNKDGRTQAIRAASRQVAEALRTAVVEGMRTRQLHLAQLAVIDRAASQAGSLSELRNRIDTEISKAGLRRISDTDDLAAFNLADDGGSDTAVAGSRPQYELLSPAYSDSESGRIVERGWVRTLPVQGLSWNGVNVHDRRRHAHSALPHGVSAEPAEADDGTETDAIGGTAASDPSVRDVSSPGSDAPAAPEVPTVTNASHVTVAVQAEEELSASQENVDEPQEISPQVAEEPSAAGTQSHGGFTKMMLAKVAYRGYKPVGRKQ